jgi:hypothetical protein
VTRRRTKSCDEAPVQTYLTVSKRSCVRLSCRSGEGGALSGGVKSGDACRRHDRPTGPIIPQPGRRACNKDTALGIRRLTSS